MSNFLKKHDSIGRRNAETYRQGLGLSNPPPPTGAPAENANTSRLQEGSTQNPSPDSGFKIYYGRNIVEGYTLDMKVSGDLSIPMTSGDDPQPRRVRENAAAASDNFRPFEEYIADKRYWEQGYDPRRIVPGYIRLVDNGRTFYELEVSELTSSNYKTMDISLLRSSYRFISPRQLLCSPLEMSNIRVDHSETVQITTARGILQNRTLKYVRFGLKEERATSDNWRIGSLPFRLGFVETTNMNTGFGSGNYGNSDRAEGFDLRETRTAPNKGFLYVLKAIGYGPLRSIQNFTVNSQPWYNEGFQHAFQFCSLSVDSFLLASENGFPDSHTMEGLSAGFYMFQYDKEQRNYSGEPRVALYIEGISSIPAVSLAAGVYSVRQYGGYSNNPARVLLDYLLNPNYGLGLQPRDINLQSFYEGQQKCYRTVLHYAPTQGRVHGLDGFEKSEDLEYEYIYAPGSSSLKASEEDHSVVLNIPTVVDPDPAWGFDEPVAPWTDDPPEGEDAEKVILQSYRRIEGSPDEGDTVEERWTPKRHVQYFREVPRYECNLALDANSSSIRGNIEEILKTMHGANLIWAEGQYKLMFEEPENLAQQTSRIRATLTDDDILDQKIMMNWPNAQDRLNRCTIQYDNEHKNFLQDEVSWPELNSDEYRTLYNLDKQPLHQDITVRGISDPYHARDLAETIVRSSRDDRELTFHVGRHFLHLEPGDLVRVNSARFSIDDVFRLEEIKIQKNWSIQLRAFRFHWTWARWDGGDPQFIDSPVPRYSFQLPRPANVVFTRGEGNTDSEVSGTLSWTYRNTQSTDVFQIRVENAGTGQTYLLGETPDTSFDIGTLVPGVYRFQVRARTVLGRLGLTGRSDLVNLNLVSVGTFSATTHQRKNRDGSNNFYVVGTWTSVSNTLWEWEVARVGGTWSVSDTTIRNTTGEVLVPELGTYEVRVRPYYKRGS